jgi:two-component system phosphate regulon sensor histidine kinase PhoR
MAVPPLALALIDALEEPALLVGGERTLAANPPARALLGRQVVGQNIRFAIRQPQVLEAILARRSARMEVLGIGGVDRSAGVTVTPLDHEVLLVRIADRSARRAAERAQVDFVANASHELRTPLAAVIGYSETLADAGELDEAFRRRFGEQIHVQARRMLQIIQDLMGLSRIEADRFLQPRERVSLAAIVRDAAEAATPLTEGRSCRVELELAPDLASVRGDAGQLRQVVDNLLHNALRYGCRQEGDRITVSLKADRGWQILSVSDEGEGIAEEHLPRLTERFYRVDAARSRDSGGTGLGLAIVKQVVERHRGLLSIRSRPGEGTTFEVRLPAR